VRIEPAAIARILVVFDYDFAVEVVHMRIVFQPDRVTRRRSGKDLPYLVQTIDERIHFLDR
jgi:hypothetical protein